MSSWREGKCENRIGGTGKETGGRKCQRGAGRKTFSKMGDDGPGIEEGPKARTSRNAGKLDGETRHGATALQVLQLGIRHFKQVSLPGTKILKPTEREA